MAKTRWYQERQRDHYFKTAKKEGYRARSAYKLKQIQKKYHLVRDGDTAVDLGAAPGGWSQVLVELVGDDGMVFGVDLRRMAPILGVRLLQGDFTHKETHDRLRAVLEADDRSAVDVVVSDMAPDMSGNYDLDQARSVHLGGMALRFADEHLKENGAFVCKVFEGVDFVDFREDVRARFRKVMQFHPPASRKQSSEVYLIAKGHRRTAPHSARTVSDDGDE